MVNRSGCSDSQSDLGFGSKHSERMMFGVGRCFEEAVQRWEARCWRASRPPGPTYCRFQPGRSSTVERTVNNKSCDRLDVDKVGRERRERNDLEAVVEGFNKSQQWLEGRHDGFRWTPRTYLTV